MRFVKNSVVVLILCLAAFGAYTLLKRTPQLNISHEDRQILEKDLGISLTSGEKSEGGQSGLFNTIEGVAPIGSDMFSSSSSSTSSTTLPGSFAASSEDAPSFQTSTQASDVPPFSISSQSKKMSDAPAFATNTTTTNTVATNASPFSEPSFAKAPQPMTASPAPLYGSQFSDAPPFGTPQPDPSPSPKKEEVPISTPTAQPNIPAPPQTVPPISSSQKIESPFDLQPDPHSRVWDGPTSSLASQSSTASPNTWGISDVNGASVSTPSVSASPFDIPADSPPYPSPAAVGFTNSIQEPTPTKPVVSDSVGLTPSPVKSIQIAQSTQEGAVFVPPQLKYLPKIDPQSENPALALKRTPTQKEEPSQAVHLNPIPIPAPAATSGPVANPIAAQTPPQTPVQKTATVPLDYQQTSIRSSMVLAPLSTKATDADPIISFSQQTPVQQVPVPQTPAPKPIEESLPKTSIVSSNAIQPKSVDVPTLPFVEPKSATALPMEIEKTKSEKSLLQPANEPISYVASVKPMEATSEIRDNVVRFVKAQCAFIDSGNASKIRGAYVQLSRLHDHRELNDSERLYLTPILDQLALDVIFSRKNHILESPYIVKQGDTVQSIADAYNITPELLAKINGLSGTNRLEPGMEIKVVLGHFDCKISTKRREMTLILGGLYAGRFPVSVGEEIEKVRGDFVVARKSESENGKILTLSNGITLRGLDHVQPGDIVGSMIRFMERDANELFDILTEKSVIVLGD